MKENAPLVYLDEKGMITARPDAPLVIQMLCSEEMVSLIQEKNRQSICERARERARDVEYPKTAYDRMLQEYAHILQCEMD
jgi:hypothetical protein